MVELFNTKKRKRTPVSTKKTIHKASRYPLSFQFSALTYKQASKALSISPQSVLVSVPTQPNLTQLNVIAGDLFSSSKVLPPHKTCIKLVEDYHAHNIITHSEWHPKGNALASVDETGKLALWNIKNPVSEWSCVYKVDLKQPLAAFLWLNSDRVYGLDAENGYKRGPVRGPRNPFGQLGFITVTVHGEITVHYQHNGSIFSTFSTPMPNIGRREISRADAGCFGMSLAGLDDWERISHATITLHEDGVIYMASHNASIQPKSVAIHTIRIKFPVRSDKGAIECKPITSLKIQDNDGLLKENNVTQMIFRKGVSTLELVLGLGDEKEDTFEGFVATWQLKKVSQSINSSFGTITNDRIALVYQSGTNIQGRFISSLNCTSTGQIIVGLSDGSIHMKLAEGEGFLKNSNSNDMVESIDDSYWTVVEPHKTEDGYVDPIVDTVLSPNGTHLLYTFSSTKVGIARITNDEITTDFVKTLTQKLQLCLLNDIDFIDLVSELVRMHGFDEYKDKPDEIMNEVLTRYELQCEYTGESSLTANAPLEEWSLAKLDKAYGLAMATYKRLPGKTIQSLNFARAVQLPTILECFISSCSTNYEQVLTVINEDTSLEDSVKIDFNSDSLWSLISLSTWTFDYIRWLLREWNMLFNRKRPAGSNNEDILEKPVHAALFLHKDSRLALIKILKMLHYFIQFSSSKPYQLEQFAELQSLLKRYTSTLLNDEIIGIKDTIAFLNALNGLESNSTEITNRWSILISSKLNTFTLADIQKITQEYKDKCAKPAIYLDNEPPYPFDVIRKRRIPNNVETYHCARCQQPVISTHSLRDAQDPCSSAQWYQSLSRRCVCGGSFY